MTPEQINAAVERGRVIWDDLVAQCANGPLPFVKFDADDPGALVSAWSVEPSGDEVQDITLGVCYADLLIHRAKNWRNHGQLSIDPARIVSEVMCAIARQGALGPIERGFLERIGQLTIIAALN
jgi:hypothetical protein